MYRNRIEFDPSFIGNIYEILVSLTSTINLVFTTYLAFCIPHPKPFRFFLHFFSFQVAACGELSPHVPDFGAAVLGGDAGRLAGKCRTQNEETFDQWKGLLHQE